MPYRIEFRPAAKKALKALSRELRERIEAKLAALASNPRPPDMKKLAGHENRWRVRVGEYRVIYEIHDDILVVLVVKIGHRRDAYR